MSKVNAQLKAKKPGIEIIEEKCISCGACTVLCPTGALCLDKNIWELRFFAEKCSSCLICKNTCPLGAIEKL
ncbi:4Fe-4S binding protein [Thermovorax subterraneus]|jgi:ferredoxin|nr:4Fe-4S binding protein [Thermovorax subterraneus]